MSRRVGGIALVLLILGAGLGGLMWKRAKDTERQEKAAAAAKAEAQLEQERQEEYEAALADYKQSVADFKDYKRCKSQLTPLMRWIQNLNSRLNIGLTPGDYGNAVGAVAVQYDRVRKGLLTDDCVEQVMEPGRKAYNWYWRASTQWNDCIDDYWNCDVDRDILESMRAKWRTADRFLGRMQRAMRSARVAAPSDKPSPPGGS